MSFYVNVHSTVHKRETSNVLVWSKHERFLKHCLNVSRPTAGSRK